MGKVVEKRGRKKKGRPSLLDLQKRNIKLQERQKHQELKNSQQLPKIQYHTPSRIHQQNPSLAAVTPASLRRSARRNSKHEANGDDDDEEDSEAAATDDDDGDLAQGQQLSGKRREKELKLVLKSPNSTSVNSKRSNCGSDSNAEDGNSGPIDRRKRKIDAIGDGSQKKDEKGEEKHGSATNPANTHHEAEAAGPSMPLPDKKLLLFILDRLQKKDTYGVFAEPVDPEELPDYHEVISHPMDFGTVRKKLAGGAYANLEQFERDVCLICSNAMQYNAPDTIYFRQARSIQELAKKDFENLRQDSDNEPETKIIRRGRPPTKNLKKAFSRCLQERDKSEFAEVTLANGGENSKKADHDLKKGSNMEKYGSTNSLRDSCYNSRHGEPHSIRLVDRYDRGDEMTGSASASKGISVRHGKRQVIIDESRRNTYKQPDGSANKKEPSVLSVFDWDRKQLIPVGLHAEYGYTRSLALFAAKLGPVAWNFASRKIQRCLPNGVQFGPGWVGENDVALRRPLPQPSCIISQTLPPHHSSPRGDSSTARTVTALESSANRSLEIPGGESSTERPVFSSQSKLEAVPNKPSLSSVSGITSTSAVSPSVAITFAGPTCGKSEAVKLQPQSAFNALNSSTGKGKLEPSFQSHQNSVIQSQVNGIGINGTYGLNATLSTRKLIAASKPSGVNFQSQLMLPRVSRKENVQSSPTTEENNNSAKGAELKNWSSRSSDDCLSPQLPPSSQQSAQQQKADSAPPDLNVGFHSPGSSTTARRESTQPDLALQL